MFGLEKFTTSQRAMTLAGLAPAVMMGCAVHAAQETPNNLPAPSYSVAMPVPPRAERPLPPPPAPALLQTTIHSLARNFAGKVGISVRSIDTGWSVDVNPEYKLPQQSVSKLWVAMTVMSQRDQGRLTLDDPVTIQKQDLTLFHQPIAALVKDSGYRTTVRDLLRRAITTSDNTANDRLLQYVGGPNAVRAFIQRNDLGAIRFGPGERLLQAKTAGLTWRQEYSLGGGFQAARSRLSPATRLAAFNAYVADPIDGASATAITMALARLKRGELLSAGSTSWLISTMQETRTGRARLRAAVPADWIVGHKTGTGQDLLGRTAGFNDVGIITAPDGSSYAVAVMIGDTSRPVQERQKLIQNVVAAVVAQHRPLSNAQGNMAP